MPASNSSKCVTRYPAGNSSKHAGKAFNMVKQSEFEEVVARYGAVSGTRKQFSEEFKYSLLKAAHASHVFVVIARSETVICSRVRARLMKADLSKSSDKQLIHLVVEKSGHLDKLTSTFRCKMFPFYNEQLIQSCIIIIACKRACASELSHPKPA